MLHDNKEQYANELVKFLEECYNIDNAEEVVSLNLAMTRDKTQTYPFVKTTNAQVAQDMLGINSDTLLIDHYDKEQIDPLLWYQKAYHWDRKSRYWRCTAQANDK